MLKDWGVNITERLVSLDEIISEYKKGNLIEVFGTGTAAIISSVGTLGYKDLEMKLNPVEPGELAHKLFDELTSIHSGLQKDIHNWLTHVEKNPVEVD
jgi:branched-chain amino acid aminotransferase